MVSKFYEEGENCPEKNCSGIFEFERNDSCSCHIRPPCSSCTDSKITCSNCGFEPEEPDYKLRAGEELAINKIDWRSRPDTASSVIKEGVYPDGTTKEEVRLAVNGTFGGKFTWFGGGRFCFIAYID